MRTKNLNKSLVVTIPAKYPDEFLRQIREDRRRERLEQAKYRREQKKHLIVSLERGDHAIAIEVAKAICGACDSEYRLNVLLETLVFQQEVPPPVFWPVWMSNWACVDYSAHFHEILPPIFRNKGSALPFYDDDQRSQFDALPDTFTVYRGCDERFASGVSWSLLRQSAESFARGGRFGTPRKPVVMTGIIEKHSPDLFYVMGRNDGEAEIICRPHIVSMKPFTA